MIWVAVCLLQLLSRMPWKNFSTNIFFAVTPLFFFFSAPFWTAEVSDSRTVSLGSLQALDETSWPLRGSWPSPSQSSLRRGWEAAGLGGWVWGLGQELAPERIITFNIGKMGAVLVEEAGGKGLQGSMGQPGRPSVDEGSCHRVLEEAGCLSGFRVCEELDKPGGFFASIFLLFLCQGRWGDIVGCAWVRGMYAPTPLKWKKVIKNGKKW